MSFTIAPVWVAVFGALMIVGQMATAVEIYRSKGEKKRASRFLSLAIFTFFVLVVFVWLFLLAEHNPHP